MYKLDKCLILVMRGIVMDETYQMVRQVRDHVNKTISTDIRNELSRAIWGNDNLKGYFNVYEGMYQSVMQAVQLDVKTPIFEEIRRSGNN